MLETRFDDIGTIMKAKMDLLLSNLTSFVEALIIAC